jgi:hypothetical protein
MQFYFLHIYITLGRPSLFIVHILFFKNVYLHMVSLSLISLLVPCRSVWKTFVSWDLGYFLLMEMKSFFFFFFPPWNGGTCYASLASLELLFFCLSPQVLGWQVCATMTGFKCFILNGIFTSLVLINILHFCAFLLFWVSYILKRFLSIC